MGCGRRKRGLKSAQKKRFSQGVSWFEANKKLTSWQAATTFCTSKSMHLCPLATYCPKGQGQAPTGGRRSGDQWARPAFREANRVLVFAARTLKRHA